MGFFGGDNEDSGNQLIEQQIAQNNREIEEKRQSITKERLDLIKSQGAPKWTPEPITSPIGTNLGSPTGTQPVPQPQGRR